MFVDAVSNGDVLEIMEDGVACFTKESRCQTPEQVEASFVDRYAVHDSAVSAIHFS